MRSIFSRLVAAVCLCIVFSLCAVAGEDDFRVTYAGGTFPDMKGGEKLTISVDHDRVRIIHDDTRIVDVPVSAVVTLQNGPDVRQVGTAVGLSSVSLGIAGVVPEPKSRRLFIGLRWDGEGHQGGAVFQVGKREYPELLASLVPNRQKTVGRTELATVVH